MIPNIVHFIWFAQPSEGDFLYVYYLAVLSAKLINNPTAIYFYYSGDIKGKWWEETKKLVIPIHKTPPTTFRGKRITQPAHQSDIVRLEILLEMGGVYLDLDTCCHKNWSHLLGYDCVMGREMTMFPSICNAVIFANKDSEFLKYWYSVYHFFLIPEGWAEASCHLPSRLSESPLLMEEIVVMPIETFFSPLWGEGEKVFFLPADPSPKLITLHLWSSYSKDILKIIDEDWIEAHPETLYGKLAKQVLRLKEEQENPRSITMAKDF